MNSSAESCIRSIIEIYQSLDQQITNFSRITGIICSEGCGLCCQNPNVEATIPELLPLAREIYLLGQEDEILERLGFRMDQDYTACILYRPDQAVQGNGRCLYYQYRPLICRLFGFAARKNKYDQIEFMPCKEARKTDPRLVQRAEIAMANNIRPPLFQESALRVAGVMPCLGFKRYPINRAIWEALAYMQWHKPVKPKRRKAA